MRSLLLILALASAGADDAHANPLAGYELVDLSHAYGPDTLYWPTSPSRFELRQLAHGETDGGWFYAANLLCTPEHGGTHLDAPMHFHRDGQSTDQVPLERLTGPIVVLDVSAQASEDADYRLEPEDVEAFEDRHGPIPEGAMVLLRTGWSERWPDALRYLGDDTPGDASKLHFPSFGAEAVELLVERSVSLLGIDTASIDYGQSRDFPVHRIIAGRQMPALENLTRLERLPPTGAWLMALPLKIEGGSGGPARVVALVPEQP